MGTDNKKARLSFGKPFVAAYTTAERGFEDGDIHPSYQLAQRSDKRGKAFHWCVRYGYIEIPWGIGADETAGFKAHGVMYVKRGKIDASTFDGKGFEFERVGDVYYLYENELIDGAFRGFSVYIRALIMPLIREIALSSIDESDFRTRIIGMTDDVKLIKLLDAHGLTPTAITCRTVSGELNRTDK